MPGICTLGLGFRVWVYLAVNPGSKMRRAWIHAWRRRYPARPRTRSSRRQKTWALSAAAKEKSYVQQKNDQGTKKNARGT